MEREVVEAELVLPTHLNFKKLQMYEKYPKGIGNILSKFFRLKISRITLLMSLIAPYYDPRTNMRYANAEVFKHVRSLPNDYVQRYLALRNAAVVLK